MTKLDETTNFIDLFTHAHWFGGPTKQPIPLKFAQWTARSLLAGAVGNRVWLEDAAKKRLYPNLYVILVAPSGLGKGTILKPVMDYLKPVRKHARFDGVKATAAAMRDILSEKRKPKKGEQPRELDPKFYLYQEELSECIGEGLIAKAFIKFMTANFGSEGSFREQTRTNGIHFVDEAPVLNWIGATPINWLKETIKDADMTDGFGARVVWLVAKKNPDYARPLFKCYPPDFEPINDFLTAYSQSLVFTPKGPITLSKSAYEALLDWNTTSKEPACEEEAVFHRRETDLLKKVSMIECLARAQERIISRTDVIRAGAAISEWKHCDMLQIIDMAASGDRQSKRERIHAYLTRHPATSKTELMRNLHLHATELEVYLRELTLMERIGEIPPQEISSRGLSTKVKWYAALDEKVEKAEKVDKRKRK